MHGGQTVRNQKRGEQFLFRDEAAKNDILQKKEKKTTIISTQFIF
jgi:hypothetical protein